MDKSHQLLASILMIAALAIAPLQPVQAADKVTNPFANLKPAAALETLNKLSARYPTAIDFEIFFAPIADHENNDLFALNLYNAIEMLVKMGFGRNKLGPWQIKQMPYFGYLKPGDGGPPCKQVMANVYYTTIIEGGETINFGFFVTSGNGFATPWKLKAQNLGMDCS